MTLFSHWFVHRRRRLGRALLLGLAVVWSTMAAAPCVAAMPTCQHTPAAMAHCPHDHAGPSTHMPDCTPLMQLDCQSAQNPTLATGAMSADHLPCPLPMVLLSTLPIAAAEAGASTDSALRHAAAAAAVPRPPLNLLHARLLV